MMQRKIPLIVLTSVLLASCMGQLSENNAAENQGSATLITPGKGAVEFSIEVARTPEEQQKGLSGRSELADNAGMLFVFPAPRPLSFWMKDTLIPLDIIFFDHTWHYVSHTTMQPCTTDKCQTYESAKPSSGALEVPAGTVERYGFGPGTELRVVLDK